MELTAVAAVEYIVACNWAVANVVVAVDGFVLTAVLVVAKDAEDTNEGATVVGGVKNDPSSRVSRKSLQPIFIESTQ